MFQNLKIGKKNIILTISFIFLIFIGYILWFNTSYSQAKKIKTADIMIEKARLETAIKSYREKTGINPQLAGNENKLNEIRIDGRSYGFDLIYGSEMIYETPADLSKNRKKSNKINSQKDNKGGWVYNIETGEVNANID